MRTIVLNRQTAYRPGAPAGPLPLAYQLSSTRSLPIGDSLSANFFSLLHCCFSRFLRSHVLSVPAYYGLLRPITTMNARFAPNSEPFQPPPHYVLRFTNH